MVNAAFPGQTEPELVLFNAAALNEEPVDEEAQLVDHFSNEVGAVVLETMGQENRTFFMMRANLLGKLFSIWKKNIRESNPAVDPRLEYFVKFVELNLNTIRKFFHNGCTGTLRTALKKMPESGARSFRAQPRKRLRMRTG